LKREGSITRNRNGKTIRYKIKRRPSQSKNRTIRANGQIRRREREKSSVRAKVEHVFGVVKNLFHFHKTRYKGRRKQAAQMNMLLALANLYLADKH
jgi:IS5 family transposase